MILATLIFMVEKRSNFLPLMLSSSRISVVCCWWATISQILYGCLHTVTFFFICFHSFHILMVLSQEVDTYWFLSGIWMISRTESVWPRFVCTSLNFSLSYTLISTRGTKVLSYRIFISINFPHLSLLEIANFINCHFHPICIHVITELQQ